MARKVFISVLGFSKYSKCAYVKNDFRSSSVCFVQQAMLEYHMRNVEWTSHDKAIILLTNGARIANWNDNGHKEKDTGAVIESEGLKACLQKMQLPFEVYEKNILDGNSEQEIWKTFESIYEELEENDEIYFDITHGFRFLPMLVLTLAFYSKFLKRTRLVSVTYGNYEARDKQTNNAPIIDLISLPALLDWSFAAGQFVESGSLKQLCELCDAELRPVLRDPTRRDDNTKRLNRYIKSLASLIDEFYLCRGASIIDASMIKSVKEIAAENVTTFISPLNPIFSKINKGLEPFDTEYNIKNTLYASRWCFDNGLYQQAATILQEGVVSFFASRHRIPVTDEKLRHNINQAFDIAANNTFRPLPATGNIILNELLSDDLLIAKHCVNTFSHLKTIRNDYNHSGMRSAQKPLRSGKIIAGIEACLQFFEEYLADCSAEPIEPSVNTVGKSLFINLSNHPVAEWGEAQKTAAKQFGEAIDMPFPAIDATSDINAIIALANEHLLKVQQLASPLNATVHLMGEQTFCYSLLKRLQRAGYKCVASTTKRSVITNGNNERIVSFCFDRFREYENL